MTGAELPYFIGTPRRRYSDSEWDAYMERWQMSGPPGLRLSFPGDKCDVARSRHVNVAKGLEPIDSPGLGFAGKLLLPQPPAITIAMDDDVFPRIALSDMLRLIHQDFEAGFDVVGAPTVNSESLDVMVWTKDGKSLGQECIEVTQVAFGFVAFSPKFIREVKPEAEEVQYEGTPMERKVPMYCHFGINEDDSSSFSKLILDQGFKLGADGRLVVTHRKGIDLDNGSAQWNRLYRDLARAGRTDLFLRAARIVQRGLLKGADQDERGTGSSDESD